MEGSTEAWVSGVGAGATGELSEQWAFDGAAGV